ncbi:2-succinylbenzoate--CoA ligase [compost metagenome]
MFKSGGYNVYPIEIEQAICEHPAVSNAVVMAMPDAKFQEVGFAFVTLKHGSDLDESALVAGMDYRIAAESAFFRLPEIGLGINMSWNSIPRLVSQLGPARAKQYVILGQRIPATMALRRIAKTPEYLVSRCERKKVEMLFAHLKRILRLDRLRLRGLTGATDEFTLAATVQNLRRMAKLLLHGPPITG